MHSKKQMYGPHGDIYGLALGILAKRGRAAYKANSFGVAATFYAVAAMLAENRSLEDVGDICWERSWRCRSEGAYETAHAYVWAAVHCSVLGGGPDGRVWYIVPPPSWGVGGMTGSTPAKLADAVVSAVQR